MGLIRRKHSVIKSSAKHIIPKVKVNICWFFFKAGRAEQVVSIDRAFDGKVGC